MVKVDVYNMQREVIGQLDLADEAFGVEVREQLFYEVVKSQLASRRRGTAAAKNRSAVAGSTKKLYKQKGTGRARQGSVRSPVHVGGGQAHPPRPRDWAYRPPRKVRAAALASALSKFASEGRLVVVDEFVLDAAKTRSFLAALARLRTERRTLVVDAASNGRLRLSARNCAMHRVLAPEGVNVYDLLLHDTLVLSSSAAKALEGRCIRKRRDGEE